MAYGGFEFAGLEYAGEDALSDGDLDEFDLTTNIEEFCTITCSGKSI